MTDTPTQVSNPNADLAAVLWPPRLGLTPEQIAQLIKPINPRRIASRQQGGKKLSYLEAWEVKAHLTRIFGFGGWDGEVLQSNLMFQDATTIGKGDNAKPGWQVGYQCIYRLRIKDLNGHVLGTWTEAAVGQNSQQDLGEAHDTACKTAESDALKRCATALGDQFGLSLYDDGSARAVVKQVLVAPPGYEQPRKDLTPEQREKLAHSIGMQGDDPANEPKVETVELPPEPAGDVPTPFDASPVSPVSS